MSDKWQRITYMPATPLYPGRPRVTESPEHIALSRRAAADGMVLLKNEDACLPLAMGTRLAVFGKASIDYVKGGGGSGDVTVSYVRNLVDGLSEKAAQGKVSCFQPLTAFYLADVTAQYAAGRHPGQTVEPELPEQLLADARAYTDTALFTVCRFSGEGWDRTGAPHDGDFYLSPEEERLLDRVTAAFPRVIVILNAGGMMDTCRFRDEPAVKAALLAGQGGMEGAMAIADILVGDVCPSGHLADTYAVDFDAYPSSAGFNESESYVAYEEDIYVGYRYFETVPGAAEKVVYPFGYGLSYTTFGLEAKAERSEAGVAFEVTVTNTGSRAGRQVAQLYASAPQGLLGKPARVLIGFGKTKLLEPGESEILRIDVPLYAFASYDDDGLVQKSAWLLEKGAYRFFCGDNVRDAKPVDYILTLDGTLVLEQLTEKCPPHDLKRRMRPDGSYVPVPDHGPAAPILDQNIPGEVRPMEWAEYDDFNPWKPVERMRLSDLAEGRVTMDEFLDQLTIEQQVHMLGGQPNRGAANTFGFGNLPYRGIPNAMTADGPAGLRIQPEAGVNTTAFPTASLIASTWDAALAEEIGFAAGEEVAENGIAVWLAPAINIHRSPLCGRNFEYYSEDPLLCGKLAAGMIRGTQRCGVATSLKHFCCNNKEVNRKESDSRVSERALREIYLKAFELCVKEAQPWTIMSSYNIVNGTRSSENRDLLTDVLRGEWGFTGVVTTDWYTDGEQWREIAAGNDIKMGVGHDSYTLEKVASGELSKEDVRLSVSRLLGLFLKLK